MVMFTNGEVSIGHATCFIVDSVPKFYTTDMLSSDLGRHHDSQRMDGFLLWPMSSCCRPGWQKAKETLDYDFYLYYWWKFIPHFDALVRNPGLGNHFGAALPDEFPCETAKDSKKIKALGKFPRRAPNQPRMVPMLLDCRPWATACDLLPTSGSHGFLG